MKFVLLYKGITLTVQGKCAKYTRVYKTPNRFCTIFKQLEFDIKTIIDSFKTFPTKINTKEIKLKSIMFELFIISKLNEICIFTILPL